MIEEVIDDFAQLDIMCPEPGEIIGFNLAQMLTSIIYFSRNKQWSLKV